jgi:hypothetical protein
VETFISILEDFIIELSQKKLNMNVTATIKNITPVNLAIFLFECKSQIKRFLIRLDKKFLVQITQLVKFL